MPATPPRTCRWVSDLPARLIKTGNPAFLRVCTHAGEEFWIVQPTEGGYLLTEELGRNAPKFGKTYRVDTTFGRRVEHWTCSCKSYAYKGGRKQVRHGCLHCHALHAALARIGIAS